MEFKSKAKSSIVDDEISEYLPTDKIRISVLRNITVEPIEEYFNYYAKYIGLNCDFCFGNYDNILQEAIGESEELLENSDFIIVFLNLENFNEKIYKDFLKFNGEELVSIKSEILEYIQKTITGLRKKSKATILWQGFELPYYPVMGIGETSLTFQIDFINELNKNIKKLIEKVSSSYFVDLNRCIFRAGNSFYDYRYKYMAKAPYSAIAYDEIAKENIKYISILKGKTKKCLVLDCDNTLWGGIVGELGLNAIGLGSVYPGNIYSDFQNEVLSLFRKGVILAVCSKNNFEDVINIFKNHPSMMLKEENIAIFNVNWNDKATNIQEIAKKLNISTDSLVFVDDDKFEIELINKVLPEVNTIHLDNNKIFENIKKLKEYPFFDKLSLTDEDKRRGEMYKTELEINSCGENDLENYLKSLNLSMTIKINDDSLVARISQLTQKTNQFNLTTKRYDEFQIENFIKDETYDVFSVSLKDKLGELGLVGVAIIKYEEDKSIIDTFLLSCRVIGRKIEGAFLNEILKHIEKQGIKTVIGNYIATKKNVLVKDFLISNGFEVLEKENENYKAAYIVREKNLREWNYIEINY